MSGTDPQELIQWQEALRWLGKADQDVRAARLLLDAVAEQAAFHVQQALEKTLKALLVARRRDIRKTHDISVLVSLVRPHWPALVTDPFPLEQVTSWYITSRYPEMIDDEPSHAEIVAALEAVERLIATVVLCAPSDLRPSS
jgi:HEPN domain-containing protein